MLLFLSNKPNFCLWDLYGSNDFGFVGFCQRRELSLIIISEAMDAMDGITEKSRVNLGQIIILN